MANFKQIKKGEFFQDNDYYEFNPRHCYMKTGTHQYLDMETSKYFNVRDKYDEEDISGEYCYRFRVVRAEVKVVK